jgi:hypothetical protein
VSRHDEPCTVDCRCEDCERYRSRVAEEPYIAAHNATLRERHPFRPAGPAWLGSDWPAFERAAAHDPCLYQVLALVRAGHCTPLQALITASIKLAEDNKRLREELVRHFQCTTHSYYMLPNGVISRD